MRRKIPKESNAMKYEMQDDEPTKTWNAKEKKSPLPFYVLIGAICFALAWIMSGAMN